MSYIFIICETLFCAPQKNIELFKFSIFIQTKVFLTFAQRVLTLGVNVEVIEDQSNVDERILKIEEKVKIPYFTRV